MIQDYLEKENGGGVIKFLDQQKVFDQVEWAWVDFVLEVFKFGGKFRCWIHMLVKNSSTCMKTNGFISNIYFRIS